MMDEKKFAIKIEGKNLVIAYLLWWFLGWAGVHRFYLNRIKSGVFQLLLVVLGSLTAVIFIGFIFLAVWFVWWALDAYFTYQMVTEENEKLGVSLSTIAFLKEGNSRNDMEQFEKLEKLHTLFEKGVLTKEEYETKKAEILNS